MSKLEELVEKIAEDVTSLKTQMGSFESRFDALDTKVGSLEGITDTLASKIIDMDKYMHEELATKTELQAAEIRLTDHIEGFTTNQKKFDEELTAEHSRLDGLDKRVTKLERNPA